MVVRTQMRLRNENEYAVAIENFQTLARKTTQELIMPTVGRDAQNVRFDETYGSITKRKSRAKYADMATLGTSKVISAYRYYKNSNSTAYQIVAYSTFLKKGDDSAGTFTNIKTALTADLHFTWITFKDRCYGFNGTDNNQVYDGSNCEDMGVPTPLQPVPAEGSATGITGTFKYKVTYLINGYQEGNASPESSSITVTDKKITVTIPISSNSRVTARQLYRTQDSGSIYYFQSLINNNTATTTTDSRTDAQLDTTILAPTDYGAPASYKYGCLHKMRIFVARNTTYKSRFIFSDIRSGIAYPDVFPANNYLDILEDNGEELKFIGEDTFGQLIAMKPSAVVKINTDSDDPVGWSGMNQVISINGCIAPYSIKKTHIGLIYLSRYGEKKKRLLLWNGSSTQPIFEELEPILSAIPDTALDDVVAEYHEGMYKMTYYDGLAGISYNNKILLINLLTGAWTIDKKNIACFCVWNGGSDWGELYAGTADTEGLLYREDTQLEDLKITLKSELDLGTYSQCQSGGSETAPTLVMIESQLADDWGATTVSAMTDLISTLDSLDANETVAPSCTYTSPVFDVSAKSLSYLYWKEIVGDDGYIRFWVRTGATSALCQAATWQGPYSTASGSDISAVTPARYIQYRVKLYTKDTTKASETYLYRGSSPNDYVVKITFGYGAIAESAIEILYLSNWLDFGWVNPLFKRLRKRMRSVKIEFEREEQSGTLTFGYYLDGKETDADRTDKDFDLATYAEKEYCIYQFPFTTFCNRFKYRLYNNDVYSITIKRLTFDFSVEPLLVII